MDNPEEAGTWEEVVDLSREDEELPEDGEASSGRNLAMSMKSSSNSKTMSTTMMVMEVTKASRIGHRRRKERPL